MLSSPEPLFVLKTCGQHHRLYLARNPTTGAAEPRSEVQLYDPLVQLTRAQASAEMRRLALATGMIWVAVLAPGPCPSCGREMEGNDLDFCYPQDRSRASYRAGCNLHDFGCGFELTAPSRKAALQAWNAASAASGASAAHRAPAGHACPDETTPEP